MQSPYAADDANIHCFSHAATPAPSYTQRDDSRFTSQLSSAHPQLNYAVPTYPGQGWRVNAYAGDQAKRYAANLPNRGVNKFAGAFATGQSTGFTSALAASQQGMASTSTSTASSSLASSINMKSSQPMRAIFSNAPAQGAFSKAPAQGTFSSPAIVSRPAGTSSLNKPFKPPTMIRSINGSGTHVSTVETRLTQQRSAVILNPIAPVRPSGTPYTLSSAKGEDFAFLRGLPTDEDDSVAPRAPHLKKAGKAANGKRSATPSSPGSAKRTKP